LKPAAGVRKRQQLNCLCATDREDVGWTEILA